MTKTKLFLAVLFTFTAVGGLPSHGDVSPDSVNFCDISLGYAGKNADQKRYFATLLQSIPIVPKHLIGKYQFYLPQYTRDLIQNGLPQASYYFRQNLNVSPTKSTWTPQFDNWKLLKLVTKARQKREREFNLKPHRVVFRMESLQQGPVWWDPIHDQFYDYQTGDLIKEEDVNLLKSAPLKSRPHLLSTEVYLSLFSRGLNPVTETDFSYHEILGHYLNALRYPKLYEQYRDQITEAWLNPASEYPVSFLFDLNAIRYIDELNTFSVTRETFTPFYRRFLNLPDTTTLSALYSRFRATPQVQLKKMAGHLRTTLPLLFEHFGGAGNDGFFLNDPSETAGVYFTPYGALMNFLKNPDPKDKAAVLGLSIFVAAGIHALPLENNVLELPLWKHPRFRSTRSFDFLNRVYGELKTLIHNEAISVPEDVIYPSLFLEPEN